MENFFISTAISYTNGPPHMGHAYEVIAADVIARFNRLRGKKVFFLTGTDEHGLKVQKKAENLNITPHKLAYDISQTFIKMSKKLNCSNDDFIRTSEERHKNAVRSIWQRMEKNGDIYLGKYSGWYSIVDEAFYQEGELKKNEKDEYVSPNNNSVEWVDENSYFFKLSRYEDKLLNLYEKNEFFIQPKSRINEIRNFVKNGLNDISISRKGLEWGIKVPNDPEHSIYVWVDALTNYISALNWPNENDNRFKSFWPADLHLIGKDITRFHAIYWPAFLLSAGIEIPKKIFAHGFILNKGEKMSKSLGNIEDPMELINTFGVDQLRYFLMRETIFGNDGNYSDELLINRVNSDLSNDLGNLSQRCLSMVNKHCNKKVPKRASLNDIDHELLSLPEAKIDKIFNMMDKLQINSYIEEVFTIVSKTNKYFSDQKPWELKNNNTIRMETVLWVTVEMIRKISIMLQPVMPESCNRLLDLLCVKDNERFLSFISDEFSLTPGEAIKEPVIIFPKIEYKK